MALSRPISQRSRGDIKRPTISSSPARNDGLPSTVYNMLPALIQSRIPRLRSLRRTVSDLRSRPLYPHPPCPTAPDVDPIHPRSVQSPPPCYTSRPTSSVAMRRGSGASDADTVQTLSDDTALLDDVRPSSSASAPSLPLYRSNFEMQSGINWKYANQGLNLLTSALQEYSTLGNNVAERTSNFSRQLYLHALTYLLKGLPPDLTAEEKLSLETALPPDTIKVIHVNASNGQLIPYPYNYHAAQEPRAPPEPSWLHRLLASSIIQVFLLLQLLLPYIKLFIGHAYEYEREHRISEWLVSSSISVVDGLGRRSIRFTNAICQMNDGKVGQAINDLTFWWVRGVAGGIHEGVSEGFMILGARDDVRMARTKS